MVLGKIALTAAASIGVLFVLTKLMGNKQMSQLSMFDYINGITIGSIAAEMATSLEGDFAKPLTAMIVYAVIILVISLLTSKSIQARRFLVGKPLPLFERGKLYKGNLKTAKLDINDFLTECRINGYFDLSELEAAYLEVNGRISFMPQASQRPLTAHDLTLELPEERPAANLVIDGRVMKKNLQICGYDETWLAKRLAEQKVALRDVFLATCDMTGQVTVYKKILDKVDGDIFE